MSRPERWKYDRIVEGSGLDDAGGFEDEYAERQLCKAILIH
jgi:hypothetical protein